MNIINLPIIGYLPWTTWPTRPLCLFSLFWTLHGRAVIANSTLALSRGVTLLSYTLTWSLLSSQKPGSLRLYSIDVFNCRYIRPSVKEIGYRTMLAIKVFFKWMRQDRGFWSLMVRYIFVLSVWFVLWLFCIIIEDFRNNIQKSLDNLVNWASKCFVTPRGVISISCIWPGLYLMLSSMFNKGFIF